MTDSDEGRRPAESNADFIQRCRAFRERAEVVPAYLAFAGTALPEALERLAAADSEILRIHNEKVDHFEARIAAEAERDRLRRSGLDALCEAVQAVGEAAAQHDLTLEDLEELQNKAAQCDRLRAENERLRAELEDVGEHLAEVTGATREPRNPNP